MMDKTNIQMRVSVRFHKVCDEIAKQFRVSHPVATEMILEHFAKGGIIMFGDVVKIEQIIKKVTREIKKQSSNIKSTPSENEKKKETSEKKENDSATQG